MMASQYRQRQVKHPKQIEILCTILTVHMFELYQYIKFNWRYISCFIKVGFVSIFCVIDQLINLLTWCLPPQPRLFIFMRYSRIQLKGLLFCVHTVYFVIPASSMKDAVIFISFVSSCIFCDYF